jgi:tRNA dimethylallyltransferase
VATVTKTSPLLVIVGETASGKSALAMSLAEKFNGEIICADSRTIYRGLDIGTAKPSASDQSRVRHHLLDVVNPDQAYSVVRFKQQALAAIDDIAGRGKLPLLVGGSGLYVDSVIFDFDFNRKIDIRLRTELQDLSVPDLQARLLDAGIPLPENKQNPRYLIRALEAGGVAGTKHELRPHTLILGLTAPPSVLKLRIVDRVDAMLAAGFVEEVRALTMRYGEDAPALLAPGYKAFKSYLQNKISLHEAKQEFIRNDWRLAKRQRTWFKRNKAIIYLGNQAEAVELVTTWLNK